MTTSFTNQIYLNRCGSEREELRQKMLAGGFPEDSEEAVGDEGDDVQDVMIKNLVNEVVE